MRQHQNPPRVLGPATFWQSGITACVSTSILPWTKSNWVVLCGNEATTLLHSSSHYYTGYWVGAPLHLCKYSLCRLIIQTLSPMWLQCTWDSRKLINFSFSLMFDSLVFGIVLFFLSLIYSVNVMLLLPDSRTDVGYFDSWTDDIHEPGELTKFLPALHVPSTQEALVCSPSK